MSDKKFSPLLSLARNAQRQRMDMQCDPQWVLDVFSERDALVTENEQLRGLMPELPPRPPEGSELPRYGSRWNGPTQPLSVPMADGYWTPWHLADALAARVAGLENEVEHARMRTKELDLLFGRYLLGMKAAVIEAEHGGGAESGMVWIWNGLAGPGELPPDEEADAQAYFDREIKAINDGMSEVMAFFGAYRQAQGGGR